ncbi:hypothetical protein ACWDEE_40260, partial [Streptomyces sp. 900105245]
PTPTRGPPAPTSPAPGPHTPSTRPGAGHPTHEPQETFAMLAFDPSTTSGQALADLFRTWCELRGPDPDGEVSGGDLTEAVSAMFSGLGLDVGGPESQVDMPAEL